MLDELMGATVELPHGLESSAPIALSRAADYLPPNGQLKCAARDPIPEAVRCPPEGHVRCASGHSIPGAVDDVPDGRSPIAPGTTCDAAGLTKRAGRPSPERPPRRAPRKEKAIEPPPNGPTVSASPCAPTPELAQGQVPLATQRAPRSGDPFATDGQVRNAETALAGPPSVANPNPEGGRLRPADEAVLELPPSGSDIGCGHMPIANGQITGAAAEPDVLGGQSSHADGLSPSAPESTPSASPSLEGSASTAYEQAPGLADTIAQLRELWRQRQAWHRAEKSLTLQGKALCRRYVGGDKTEGAKLHASIVKGAPHPAAIVLEPFIAAGRGFEAKRKDAEKRLAKLAAQTPCAALVTATRGVGMLSYAGIVGEAGDIGSYRNHSCLWKRFGLGLIGDVRQQKKSGAEGIIHGYSPSRRSLMWTIGDCIVKAGGPLRELYEQRKAYEVGRGVEKPIIAHRRAQRYVEKRLLRELYRAWRAQDGMTG